MKNRYGFFLLLLTGCAYDAVNKDTFFDDFALAQCIALQKCHRSRFDGQYKTMESCLDEIAEDAKNEYDTLFAECSFQQDQAQTCIDLMRAASCEEHWDDEKEIYSSCHEDVWDCPIAQ